MTTHTSHSDSRLRWTMRIVGLMLASICAFLLTTDMVRTQESIAFLGIAAVLGTVTFISSWFASPAAPVPERVRS